MRVSRRSGSVVAWRRPRHPLDVMAPFVRQCVTRHLGRRLPLVGRRPLCTSGAVGDH